MLAESQLHSKGPIMSDQENTDPSSFQGPVRLPVFSHTIDRLIKEIWELGGMEELRTRIETLRQLPQQEFEEQLQEIIDRLKSST